MRKQNGILSYVCPQKEKEKKKEDILTWLDGQMWLKQKKKNKNRYNDENSCSPLN